ncbi:MAG: RNA polymerase factor sigma-54 [Pseudomonadota bacterium]
MIGPRLELRQSQQLVMTPQLQQAIRLLQMSNLELSRFLETELERNPLLERAEAEGEAAAPVPETAQPGADAALRGAGPGDLAGAFESGAENVFDDGAPGGGWKSAPAAPSGEAAPIEETLGAEPSLLDHVMAQIRLMRAPPLVRDAALMLAGELDEAGYLRVEPEEAAARLGVDAATLEAAVALIQGCEPAGIGARSLAECLALQLAERDRLDPAMQALLDNLPLLARADFRALSRICGVEEDEVREMAAELRGLDPRPGRAFGAPPALTAPPDVFVRRAPDGGWRVELNTDTLPRVLVNNAYAARLSAGGDAAARSFVSECRQSGGFLVRSLEQRARTILKVATEVVRRQQAFLEQGVSALRPMTLRQVADEIGMHESTVSRVAAGKTLACERGVFELRGFFTQALGATDGGEAHSAAAIQARIRALIEKENPRKTLSDDRIMAILREDGVDIARRTVAKYREGMNIPSSVQRRRLKAAAASS